MLVLSTEPRGYEASTHFQIEFPASEKVHCRLVSAMSDLGVNTLTNDFKVMSQIAGQVGGRTLSGKQIAAACIDGIFLAAAAEVENDGPFTYGNPTRARWFFRTPMLVKVLTGDDQMAQHQALLELANYGFQVV